jgi:hypothetical protein
MSSNQGASNQQSTLAAAGRNTVIAFVLAAVVLAIVIVLTPCRPRPCPLTSLLLPSLLQLPFPIAVAAAVAVLSAIPSAAFFS